MEIFREPVPQAWNVFFFKMHGRKLEDSPIIGAGLYADNEIGAATATGHGEEAIRITGHLVVELMRQGKSPQKA